MIPKNPEERSCWRFGFRRTPGAASAASGVSTAPMAVSVTLEVASLHVGARREA
jgi:hypothetical protein